ncbi:unnamed protein product, partial [Ectocarpus sp. 12 AP-2014]
LLLRYRYTRRSGKNFVLLGTRRDRGRPAGRPLLRGGTPLLIEHSPMIQAPKHAWTHLQPPGLRASSPGCRRSPPAARRTITLRNRLRSYNKHITLLSYLDAVARSSSAAAAAPGSTASATDAADAAPAAADRKQRLLETPDLHLQLLRGQRLLLPGKRPTAAAAGTAAAAAAAAAAKAFAQHR